MYVLKKNSPINHIIIIQWNLAIKVTFGTGQHDLNGKVTLLAGDHISRTNFVHFTIRDKVWSHARVTLIVRWLFDRGDYNIITRSDRVH